MITGTGLRILETLLTDLTKRYSILELSKKLKMPYAQAHEATKTLLKRELVSSEKNGKALMISVNLRDVKRGHIFAELSRRDKILAKYKKIRFVYEDLKKLKPEQYICVLFGSYAKQKPKAKSDIDLLFIIPDEYNYGTFERNARTILIGKDIEIASERGLLEMWGNPGKLNVGNELLKGHIILKGAEAFLNLRRRYYVG